MIHKPPRTPSYIWRSPRGVYYFRLRTPAAPGAPSREVRRSLRTGNRREALALARIHWLKFQATLTNGRSVKTPELELLARVVRELEDEERPPAPPHYSPQTQAPTASQPAQEAPQAPLAPKSTPDQEPPALAPEAPTAPRTPVQYVTEVDPNTGSIRFIPDPNDPADIEAAKQAGIEIALARSAPKRQPKGTAAKFSTVAADFIKWKLAEAAWSEPSSETQHKGTFELFARIVGDKAFRDITTADVTQFMQTARELPPNINKPPYKGRTIQQIRRMMRAPDHGRDKVKPKTVSGHRDRLKALFKWGAEQVPPLIDRSPILSTKGKRTRGSHTDKREAFTPDELRALFGGYLYTGEPAPSKWHKVYCAHWWLLPVCLFTSLRANEAAGLRVEDFSEDFGIKFLRVASYSDKSVKTDSALRTIPLHPELLRLGLWGYVEELRQEGKDRLLWEFPLRKKGGYGAAASDFFTSYAKHCGVHAKLTKTLHSTRHTTAQAMERSDVPLRRIQQVAGHAPQGVTARHYLSRSDLEAAYRALVQTDFQVDLSHLDFAAFRARVTPLYGQVGRPKGG